MEMNELFQIFCLILTEILVPRGMPSDTDIGGD